MHRHTNWKKHAWLWCTPILMVGITGCGPRIVMLHPQGPVARTEVNLMVISAILIAIVVIPVILLLWFMVRRYRDVPGNQAPYDPEWAESGWLETVWWAIPIIIVGVLGYFTVRDTYALTKPPETNGTPITLEVTSLDWKWLFMYPDQGIATVNYCEIPANRPVQFVMTADSPINSFWVPELAGQEYTMPGMAMRLWVQADQPGTYWGRGANFTGKGFAHMHFQVIARNTADFNSWVKHVKATAPVLTREGYRKLAEPSVINTRTYSSYPEGIFQDIIMREGGMAMQQRDKTVLRSLH